MIDTKAYVVYSPVLQHVLDSIIKLKPEDIQELEIILELTDESE